MAYSSSATPKPVRPTVLCHNTASSWIAALAELLHDQSVNAVYTSMLLRAFQTGAALATDHALPVVTDERINEVTVDPTGVPREKINTTIGDRLRQWLAGQNRAGLWRGELQRRPSAHSGVLTTATPTPTTPTPRGPPLSPDQPSSVARSTTSIPP
ncbi:hypothetical protein D0Z08_28555 [Nocardioides immobilis]|uniref:Uncharacterized protein n=1 Tax=Nocardioides immobilis TaxID=2049295 RepID=A0A417XTL3_9ACTN|nr:hypothetical protein D0Z08_28555 [Nocardioides immobilis]